MRIFEFAIRNHSFTLVVFLLFIALGYNAYNNIARTEDPEFDGTGFRVVATYPGADPAEIEAQVVEPIEDAINGLDELHEITSTSGDGFGTLFIDFEPDADSDKKYDEVLREINALRSRLPAGVVDIEVYKLDPSRVNITQAALVSDTVAWATLADLAEDLQDRIERVAGVRAADAWAYPQRELRVELNLQRLAELGLSASQLLSTIERDSVNVPGGPVETETRRFNVRTSGSYRSLDEVRATVVHSTEGRLIRVGDIATVEWSYGAQEYTARLDGRRAVFVTAEQKQGQNIFNTQAQISAALAEFARTLPANVELVPVFDQSRNVATRLSRLSADLVIAIAMVLVTLLPLGLRAAGIVMISIPLSLAMGLAALHFAGFSLNQLSIAGFVVALGLLVDDSIVVTENIARFLRMGHAPTQAALLATRQIALAVIGCTATLILAFLPLLALPGGPGKFIRSLPVTVIFTVLASLLVAFTIIPFLASRVLNAGSSHEGNALLRRLLALIHRVYAPLLARALAAPRRTLGLATAAVVASVALVPLIGFSVFPKAATPQFLVQINLPTGTGLMQTDTVLRRVEAELRARGEVKHVIANLGRGNPRIYYNINQHELSSNYAEAFVILHEFDPRNTPRMFDELRAAFVDIAGAEIIVKEFENGPPVDAPIALRVVGEDLQTLRTLAAQVEQVMRDTPGTRNVVDPLRRSRMDVQLSADPQRAGLLGVSPPDADLMIRLALTGLQAGDFREPDGDSYPIVLRAPMQRQATLDTLSDIHVAGSHGQQVPLAQLARPKLVQSPPYIDRYNRERSVQVTAYEQTGYNTEEVTAAVVARIRQQIAMPAGYRLQVGGAVETRQESFAGFGSAILIAAFGIAAVLVLEFGGFASTLIIATVIPLGVMGGVLMLFVTGNTLSFTAMIGFIALIGIEIKNSILLVDFTNQLRREGAPLQEAIIRAGEIRFLPILLTSATAIGGLLPLALQDSALYSPLAWVIIGGLITSTLLGRLVTPVMYQLLPPRLPDPENNAALLQQRTFEH